MHIGIALLELHYLIRSLSSCLFVYFARLLLSHKFSTAIKRVFARSWRTFDNIVLYSTTPNWPSIFASISNRVMEHFPVSSISFNNEGEQANFLEDDLEFLLSLQQQQSYFDISSFDNSSLDLGYVNVLTPFGSFESLDLIMEDNSLFPRSNEGLAFEDVVWGVGDGFGIDPAVLEKDGSLSDMSLDIGEVTSSI